MKRRIFIEFNDEQTEKLVHDINQGGKLNASKQESNLGSNPSLDIDGFEFIEIEEGYYIVRDTTYIIEDWKENSEPYIPSNNSEGNDDDDDDLPF